MGFHQNLKTFVLQKMLSELKDKVWNGRKYLQTIYPTKDPYKELSKFITNKQKKIQLENGQNIRREYTDVE